MNEREKYIFFGTIQWHYKYTHRWITSVEPRIFQLSHHFLVVHEGVVVRDVLGDVVPAGAGVEAGAAPRPGGEGGRESGDRLIDVTRGVDRQ